jgi:serine/threonine-protein kinase
VDSTHRFNAACAAALAGCGQGNDAATLDATERAHWREQAADWLRANLMALHDAQKLGQRQQVVKTLAHWQNDPDLAGVRDAQSIAELPEAERRQLESLWAEVQRLLDESQLQETSSD